MERSGGGAAFTVTVSVDDLSETSVSPGSDTVAVLLMLPEAVLLTPTVSVTLAVVVPLAIGPALVQVTDWAAFWQVHPVPVAET